MFKNAKVIGHGITYEEYSKQNCERGDRRFVMSRGELMDFAACPHKWLCGYKSDDTKATEWGSLMDCLALSPTRFTERFAICPEKYTNEKGEEKDWNFNANVCKEWKKRQNGKQIVKHDALLAANRAVCALGGPESIRQLLASSKTQVMASADWEDAETGMVIPLKVLIDLVPKSNHPRFGKTLADLKTGSCAAPHAFEKQVYDSDYDAQAALYRDVYESATGEDRPDWLFILQESYEPYEVAYPLPALSEDFKQIGRTKYESALRLYARCLATNIWPSYSPGHRMTVNGMYFLEPKPWMLMQAMESAPATSL